MKYIAIKYILILWLTSGGTLYGESAKVNRTVYVTQAECLEVLKQVRYDGVHGMCVPDAPSEHIFSEAK